MDSVVSPIVASTFLPRIESVPAYAAAVAAEKIVEAKRLLVKGFFALFQRKVDGIDTSSCVIDQQDIQEV